MKTTTCGAVPHLDLGPVLALVPALWGEWDQLRFAPGGEVLDPLTGGTRPELRLTGGAHRQPGASYLVTLPPTAPPDGAVRPAPGSSSTATPTEVAVVVERDDGRTLDLSLRGSEGHWTAEVAVARGLVPRVELTARIDIRGLLRAEGQSGCVAALVGSSLQVTAMVDAAPLEGRGSQAAEATVRVRRVRAHGAVAVTPRPGRWDVTGDATLRGRGLGRVVLAVAGGWIRRTIDRQAVAFWAAVAEGEDDRRAELEQLEAEVAVAGGPGPFVRRALWDPTFDPTTDDAASGQPATRSSREAVTALTKRSRSGTPSRSSER